MTDLGSILADNSTQQFYDALAFRQQQANQERRDLADELRSTLGNYQPPGIANQPSPLGVQGPNQGTGEGTLSNALQPSGQGQEEVSAQDEHLANLAKGAKGLRTALASPAFGVNKDALETMSLGQMKGLLGAITMQQQDQERQMRMQELDAALRAHNAQVDSAIALQKQREADLANEARFPDFMRQVSRYQPAENIPMMMAPEYLQRYGLPAGQTTLGPTQLADALAQSNYRLPASTQDDLLRALVQQKPGGFVPGNLYPVPGRPDLTFAANSASTGSFLPLPKTGPATPEEAMLPNGKPSGWAKFPDGEWRQLRAEKSAIDASLFDTDGDGIVSPAEYNAALAKLPFLKEYGIFPGMRVTPKEGQGVIPPKPVTGGSIMDRFNLFRKSRSQ